MRSVLKATRECKPEIVFKHEVVTWDPSIFSTTSLFKPKKSKRGEDLNTKEKESIKTTK